MVYPNPNYSGVCTISGWAKGGGDMQLTLYNTTMSAVADYIIPAESRSFQFKIPQPGVLFYTLKTGDGCLWRGKVIHYR
jgi:hypothetical protein